MRLQIWALGAIALLGCGVPAVADAQETMPAIQPKREWHVGGRLSVYHDNNISRSSKAVALTRGLKQEDFIYTPQLTVSVVQPFGRQAAFINGEAGYDLHQENTKLDRPQVNLTGGLATQLGMCRQVTYAGYRASQSELSSLDLGASKNLQQTNSVAAGLQCGRSTGPGGSVLVQRADIKNSETRLKLSDATNESLLTSLSYSQPSLGTVSLNFNYSGTEYPNRINPGRPVGDGFFIQSYGVAVQRRFSSRFTISGQASRTHVKREFAPPGFDPVFNSNSYALDATYGFGRRLEFEAHARQEVMPSAQVGKTYDKRRAGEVLARYRAGKRMTVTTGFQRQDVDSNADTAGALRVVTNSRLKAVYGAVQFTPNDIMSLTLNVRYEDRDTNLPDFNYTATRIGLVAQANF